MTHHVQGNERDSRFQPEWEEADLPGSWGDLLELLGEHGFDGMAQAMQLLMNEAMKLERCAVLGARPYERTPRRRGQANGFKDKRMQTRLGPLDLRVPQTRNVEFYPTALERGQRSEQESEPSAVAGDGFALGLRVAALAELVSRSVFGSLVVRIESVGDAIPVFIGSEIVEPVPVLVDKAAHLVAEPLLLVGAVALVAAVSADSFRILALLIGLILAVLIGVTAVLVAVAAVLMIAGHGWWPYAAMLAGGIYLDAGGREAAKVQGLRAGGVRIGRPREACVTLGYHASMTAVGLALVVYSFVALT